LGTGVPRAAAGPRATPDERREYVEAALNGNRLDLSRPILAELLRASPTSPELLALLVRQHLLMRDLPRAAATARLLLSKDPGNRRRQLLLGTVLRESPAEPARQEGRRLLGSYLGNVKTRSELPQLVDWYMDGRITLDGLISHRMPLDDIARGFGLLASGEARRVVVTP
jgi:hypothetical protein